ncbi:MAG: AraC family transcriptional regulator [Lachnospiraceae bacterium]|nr:AraC family transcriptional regulator [Lachnospiraceae bacterium]
MSLQNEWHLKELKEEELSRSHRPMEEEYNFYQAVRCGDMDFVRKNCREGDFANPDGMGILSHNKLTNIKYHFVITVALVTRLCVEGGMELEQAYRLSDFYILKLDSCSTVKEVCELHDNMALDFTGKMLLLQKNAILSKSILQCTEYIYNHIQERITVTDLAEYVNLSDSYLSRLFKKEIGISISDYIREKKIEKAQNLLKYSDFTYIEIANYLAFSSQSHFIQTFEKQVGMTPKKYRDKNYHSTW